MQVCPWAEPGESYQSSRHQCRGAVTMPRLYLPPLSLCRCCLCREPDIGPGPVQPQCSGLSRNGHRGDQPQTEEEDQYWDQHPSGLRKEFSGGEKLLLSGWTVFIHIPPTADVGSWHSVCPHNRKGAVTNISACLIVDQGPMVWRSRSDSDSYFVR